MTDDDLTALAIRLQAACLERGLTVATAESCTGGLVAEVITRVPGSSGYFLGGIVSYADVVKASELDVPAALLSEHGAVSAPVAAAMAEGARRRIGVDLAVSVTGIAGPEGGTATKPVGLTFIGLATATETTTSRDVWPGDREDNRRASAVAALEALISAAEASLR